MASSQSLEAFVRERLGSMWAVELLLLLRREPARRWPRADLVSELRASEALVEDLLERLEMSELVSVEAKGVQFAPASAALGEQCAALEAAYRERPMTVINIIARRSDRRHHSAGF